MQVLISLSQLANVLQEDDTDVVTNSDRPSTPVDISTPLTPVDKFLAYVNMKASWGLHGDEPEKSGSQDADADGYDNNYSDGSDSDLSDFSDGALNSSNEP